MLTATLAQLDVRLDARLEPVAAVPEILLHQADPAVGLWALTDGDFRGDEPPPFWAFAWPGGRGLARFLLDHPGSVAGRRVLDLGAGSGLTAIAAAQAGAAQVWAVDVAPLAVAAIQRNAAANGVAVRALGADLLDGEHNWADVVLGGDVFYSPAMAGRVLRFLRRAGRAGAAVLVGDPEREFLPHRLFDRLAGYRLDVSPVLEGVGTRPVSVWRLRSPGRVSLV